MLITKKKNLNPTSVGPQRNVSRIEGFFNLIDKNASLFCHSFKGNIAPVASVDSRPATQQQWLWFLSLMEITRQVWQASWNTANFIATSKLQMLLDVPRDGVT